MTRANFTMGYMALPEATQGRPKRRVAVVPRAPTQAEVDARMAAYKGFFAGFTTEQLDALRKDEGPHPEILGTPSRTTSR
jgi:hypothetical protein